MGLDERVNQRFGEVKNLVAKKYEEFIKEVEGKLEQVRKETSSHLEKL